MDKGVYDFLYSVYFYVTTSDSFIDKVNSVYSSDIQSIIEQSRSEMKKIQQIS